MRFEDSRVQINPHSGADSTVIVVDNVAVLVDDAVDIGGIIMSVTGRPQPPPAVAVAALPSAIRNCIIRRLAPHCTIGIEIFIRLRDATIGIFCNL